MTGSSLRRGNRLATAIYRRYAAARTGFTSTCAARTAATLRRWWLRFDDPPVEFEWPPVGRLAAPLSHELGYIAVRVPEYGRNLSRVALAIAQRWPGFAAIDIGANIGDSALMLRQHGAGAVLCVEGAADYLPYLWANTNGDRALAVAPTYVSVDVPSPVVARATRGSLRFERSHKGGEIPGRPLSGIVTDHPQFRSSRLIKIDTDGFDLAILAANEQWLGEVRPVLFFEYLPFFFRQHAIEPSAVWEVLLRAGYAAMLVWDNRGEFIAELSLADQGPRFRGVMAQFERQDTEYYGDVALFPSSEFSVAKTLAESERALTASFRIGSRIQRP